MVEKVVHTTVLLTEAVDALVTNPAGIYVDATFGRGGHSREILRRLSSEGCLLSFDKDPQAIAAAQQLVNEDKRFSIVHSSFAELENQILSRFAQIDGILMDLGVSSPQLDEAERGFSFMRDGPLDMRMDTQHGETAAQWLARASENDMTHVFKHLGEERYARKVARAIVQRRNEGQPLVRTGELANLICETIRAREEGKHPATRVFQSIRIFINKELEDLQAALAALERVIRPGGRAVIISFHSLEDRLVKRCFKVLATRSDIPKNLPITSDMIKPKVRLIGRGEKPSEFEIKNNVRSRSAVMRVAEFYPQ